MKQGIPPPSIRQTTDDAGIQMCIRDRQETDELIPSQTTVLDADDVAQKHSNYQMIPGGPAMAKDPTVVRCV